MDREVWWIVLIHEAETDPNLAPEQGPSAIEARTSPVRSESMAGFETIAFPNPNIVLTVRSSQPRL